MSFVSDVESNQKRGDLFQDARRFQLAAVNRAYAGNLGSQSPYFVGGVGVVAADDDIAVDRSVGIQQFGGGIVERGHHRHSLGNQFGGLLRDGALPDAEGTSGAAAHAGRQR